MFASRTRTQTTRRRTRSAPGRCIAPDCGRRCRGNLCSPRCARHAAAAL